METPPPSEPPKIVSLFSREEIKPEDVVQENPFAALVPQVDQKSVNILQDALDAAKKGEVTGCAVVGTSETGLPRYWAGFPKGISPQVYALRHLGNITMLASVMQKIVLRGLEETE
jgi:hypothetical protein